MLDIKKLGTVTRPDFPKKFRVVGKSRKTGENWGLKKTKKNGSNDFDKKLQEDRGDGYGAAEKNRRSKSFLDHPKSPKTCNFRGFFELFSKNRIQILPLKRQNKEEMDSDQFWKNPRSNPFQEVEIYTVLHVSGGYTSQNVLRFRLGRHLKNGSNDFPDFLHDVRYQKVRKRNTAGFLKKKPSRPKISKNRWKLRFSKN